MRGSETEKDVWVEGKGTGWEVMVGRNRSESNGVLVGEGLRGVDFVGKQDGVG